MITAAHDIKSSRNNADKVQAATRDSDYWYDTGDLIIVSRGVRFRVWERLVAEISVVFQVMFTQSTSEDAEDRVDGCFVVLLDDSPNDWRELFGLLCPQSTNIQPSGPTVNMAYVSAMVRLGRKYGFKDLYDKAMGCLTTYYTTSFDAWADGHNIAQWQPDPVHAITTINLARLTNTPSILPTAFYICATLGPDVVCGVPLKDGSTEHLTLDDLHLVLELQTRLAASNARTAFLLFQHPSGPGTCAPIAQAKCGEVWRRLLEHAGLATSTSPHAVASARALDGWVANVDSLPKFAPTPARVGSTFLIPRVGWYQPHTLCERCSGHLERRDRELRREVWRKMPEFLGLTIEGWDEA